MTDDEYRALAQRLGRLHLQQRIGIERDYEARVFGQGLNFFHIENWYSVHSLMRRALKVSALYGRGKRNALDIRVRHHEVNIAELPPALNGYTVLQLSDVHLDMNEAIAAAVSKRIQSVDYDLCVITGDFRGQTYGPWERAVQAMAEVYPSLRRPAYCVLGNHDSIEMLPALERLGLRVLMNENVRLEVGGSALYLAGVDDPHYYCVDNIEKAAQDIPPHEVSILLSHSPEIYKQASHCDFNLMLCGHTHGGQICLPGGFPLMTNARCPRRFCSGPWRHNSLLGYTSSGTGSSVVDVRFNCPPEITLHHLRAA